MLRHSWGLVQMQRSSWYVQSQSGRCLLQAPFSFGPHFRSTINDDGDLRGTVMVSEGYTGMIQPSEQDVLEACHDATQQKARRLAAEDEGGEVGPRHRRMPTTAELEGKVPLQHAEPYSQARAPLATNMKAACLINRMAAQLEYNSWDVTEVADLCHDMLCQVRDDTEAQVATRQKPQVPTSLLHMIFDDTEAVHIFTDCLRDVGLRPVSVKPEPWLPGQTERERLDAM